ncbi:hypothetical protein GDO86_008309 [Hymenochirus boettgeri]|uniref:Uncharacterized protein n=1 Tax=Hymenochirus boettgeri TaxID=247094 RepID=A0A8T2J558_9PIPI|nr:hypothetical protein GDO86_008309 [Hymenochirus boettgeri]
MHTTQIYFWNTENSFKEGGKRQTVFTVMRYFKSVIQYLHSLGFNKKTLTLSLLQKYDLNRTEVACDVLQCKRRLLETPVKYYSFFCPAQFGIDSILVALMC